MIKNHYRQNDVFNVRDREKDFQSMVFIGVLSSGKISRSTEV